jgi:hemin uptake protein HemP
MKSIRFFLWANFAIGAVLSVIAQVHSEDYSSAIPTAVTRRVSLDFHTILQGNNTGFTNINCDVDNATYLVEDNQCINNQYLFNGKEKCITLYDNNYYTLMAIIITTLQHRMPICNNSK